MTDDKKKSLLLADDETHIRALIKTIVKGIGIDVVAEASNGAEALEKYKQTRPDILMLDINMPLKTGDEVLREVIAENPDACVIMLTSVSDIGTIGKCIEIGAANYIRKDTPLGEMKAIIRETCGIT